MLTPLSSSFSRQHRNLETGSSQPPSKRPRSTSLDGLSPRWCQATSKLTFTLDLPRELAERLSARAIREGKNLDAVVIETLERGRLQTDESSWPKGDHHMNTPMLDTLTQRPGGRWH
jgi:hypothetical protein